jgi:SAM-dependent methyltransferase
MRTLVPGIEAAGRGTALLPYERLAGEYYGAEHKTSRNLDLVTKEAVRSLGWEVPQGLTLEPGCGRGRCGEFLHIDTASSVVHLDNSPGMLAHSPREPSVLRVLHDAEILPFADGEFSSVAAFLCDAFLGLNFLAESCRVLALNGLLLGTTPSYEWGVALREAIAIDPMTTRFVLGDGTTLTAPSSLFQTTELRDMLVRAGFRDTTIHIERHALPEGTPDVSPDVVTAANSLSQRVYDLPLLYSFSASR